MPARRDERALSSLPGGVYLPSGWAEFNEAGLFAFATHVIVPIHVGALRIVAPRPHVQLEKRIEVEAIGRADELKVLSVERRRYAFVVFEPRRRVHDVLDADEFALISDRLVNQRLRILDAEFVLFHHIAVYIVNSHGSVVGSTDAAERRIVAGANRTIHVEKLTRRVADVLHELGILLLMISVILSMKRNDRERAAKQAQAQNSKN